MQHRHNGPMVRYRTRRGRIRLRRRPLHSQMLKYKSKSYAQLKKKFNIHPFADDDGDGKRNYEDCRPWDKNRHYLTEEEKLEEGYIKLRKSESDKQMYTLSDDPDNIYIGKFEKAENVNEAELAEMVAHEEAHNVLKEQDVNTSQKLDVITVPFVTDDETGEILNPDTAGSIEKDAGDAIESAERELRRRNVPEHIIQDKTAKAWNLKAQHVAW